MSFRKVGVCWLAGLQICLCTAKAQEANGWSSVWQKRMTIGEAQLDAAFKLAEKGRASEALQQIDSLIAANPNNWRAYVIKAAVLTLIKQNGEALKQMNLSISVARKSNVSNEMIAALLSSKARTCRDAGNDQEARRSLEAAYKYQPNSGSNANDLAWLLATSRDPRVRDGRRAVSLALRVCSSQNWTVSGSIDTLAAAYATSGDFTQATKYQELAIARLSTEDRRLLQPEMTVRFRLYTNHQAYFGG